MPSAEDPDGQNAGDKAQGNGRPAPVQGFFAYKTGHLFWRGAQTAKHPEKFHPPGHTAVQAAGDHQDPGQRYQKSQDGGNQIELQDILVVRLKHQGQQSGILPDGTFINPELIADILYHMLDAAERRKLYKELIAAGAFGIGKAEPVGVNVHKQPKGILFCQHRSVPGKTADGKGQSSVRRIQCDGISQLFMKLRPDTFCRDDLHGFRREGSLHDPGSGIEFQHAP